MKVILINPPREVLQVADYPPLGLAYISAALRQDGHDVKILDAASWSWERLANEVELQSPEIIGITCWTIERGQAFKTACIAKQVAPNAKIIMGGPHATAFPRHMFIKAPVDYVVLGEGEMTIRELITAIERRSDMSHIKGIAFKRNEDIVIAERRDMIIDINSIPIINHAEFEYNQYNGLPDTTRKAAAIMTSRGCPFRCIYCSSTVYWGNKYRTRSIESVMLEIENLYEKQGIRALLVFDDNLLIGRSRCIEFCKALIAKDYDLIWAAEGTVKVDEEMLVWMKRAGCYRIDFGVESGSPEILKNIKKPFKVEDSINAFKLCKKIGIKANAYMLFGAPGETVKTIKETVGLMQEIQPNCNGYGRPGVWILPNTEIYEMSKTNGVITDDTWLETDEILYYNVEHTTVQLMNLVRKFNLGMLKKRSKYKYYLLYVIGFFPYEVELLGRALYKKMLTYFKV
jgi:radical SAM superfamily enzyme YgiQ (UPF0313 family)